MGASTQLCLRPTLHTSHGPVTNTQLRDPKRTLRKDKAKFCLSF